MSAPRWSSSNSAVKRINREVIELRNDPRSHIFFFSSVLYRYCHVASSVPHLLPLYISDLFVAGPLEVRNSSFLLIITIIIYHLTSTLLSCLSLTSQDDIFEWHFTIKGPEGSDFESGVYHGRLTLPTDWPYKPPDVYFLTVSLLLCLYTAHS